MIGPLLDVYLIIVNIKIWKTCFCLQFHKLIANIINYNFLVITCPDLTLKQHMEAPRNFSKTFASNVTVRCENGYEFGNDKREIQLTCSANVSGEWSADISDMNCSGITYCLVYLQYFKYVKKF